MKPNQSSPNQSHDPSQPQKPKCTDHSKPDLDSAIRTRKHNWHNPSKRHLTEATRKGKAALSHTQDELG